VVHNWQLFNSPMKHDLGFNMVWHLPHYLVNYQKFHDLVMSYVFIMLHGNAWCKSCTVITTDVNTNISRLHEPIKFTTVCVPRITISSFSLYSTYIAQTASSRLSAVKPSHQFNISFYVIAIIRFCPFYAW